jgi:hypothetical protein
MKGFIYIGNECHLNNNIIKEIKEYSDCRKILTIYNETYRIKKENKNAR